MTGFTRRVNSISPALAAKSELKFLELEVLCLENNKTKPVVELRCRVLELCEDNMDWMSCWAVQP